MAAAGGALLAEGGAAAAGAELRPEVAAVQVEEAPPAAQTAGGADNFCCKFPKCFTCPGADTGCCKFPKCCNISESPLGRRVKGLVDGTPAVVALVVACLALVLLLVLYPIEETIHDVDWNSRRKYFGAALFILCVASLSSLYFDVFDGDFALCRIVFTVPSVALLFYRTVLYFKCGWSLFLLDLCPVTQICLLWTLWFGTSTSFIWKLAMFACINGPVAGSTFLLAIKLEVDSPEAFESFYLHVVGMLLSIKMREFIIADGPEHRLHLPSEDYQVWKIIKTCHTKMYLRWLIPYGIFLSLQPFLKPFDSMLTLFDYNVHAGKPLRDMAYWMWLLEVWGYLAAHALMATIGMAAAAFSFDFVQVHYLYTVIVLIGTSVRTARALIWGISSSGLMGMAWGLLWILLSFALVGTMWAIGKCRGWKTWRMRAAELNDLEQNGFQQQR